LNLASTASLDRSLSFAIKQYLDGFTRNYNIRTQLDVDADLDEERLRPEMRLQLLRILQEALSNARRHGQAHQARIALAVVNGCLRMTAEDDGCGFDAQGTANFGGSHYGLGFMRARAGELGGTLQVTSAPGCGTRVALEIPLNGSGPTKNGRSG
jgi:signal transduction histidine kinase